MGKPQQEIIDLDNEMKSSVGSTNRVCVSDRIFSYLQWGLKKANLKLDSRVYDMYKNLRADGYFINKHPITMAVALSYVNGLVLGRTWGMEGRRLYGREPKPKETRKLKQILEKEYNIKFKTTDIITCPTCGRRGKFALIPAKPIIDEVLP